jgi:hypothetical protein
MIDLFVEGVSPMHAPGPARLGVRLSALVYLRACHFWLRQMSARTERNKFSVEAPGGTFGRASILHPGGVDLTFILTFLKPSSPAYKSSMKC